MWHISVYSGQFGICIHVIKFNELFRRNEVSMLKERSHMHLTTDKFIGMTSDASKHKQLMHTSRIHNICNVSFFWKYNAWSKVCKIVINATNCLQLCCRHSFPIKYVINEHQYRVTTRQLQYTVRPLMNWLQSSQFTHTYTTDFCPKTLQFITGYFTFQLVHQCGASQLNSSIIHFCHNWNIST